MSQFTQDEFSAHEFSAHEYSKSDVDNDNLHHYWKNFLNKAGIPEPVANQYATLLCEAEWDKSLLPELNFEWLKEMGIETPDHQSKILQYRDVSVDRGDPNKSALERRSGRTVGRESQSLMSFLPNWDNGISGVRRHMSLGSRAPSDILFALTNAPVRAERSGGQNDRRHMRRVSDLNANRMGSFSLFRRPERLWDLMGWSMQNMKGDRKGAPG